MSARALFDELVAAGWITLERWLAESRTESLAVDFKRGGWDRGDVRSDDRRNLAKALSGFGNTEGGLLLLGAGTSRTSGKADVLNSLEGVAPLAAYAERVRALVRDITTPTIPGVQVVAIPDPSRSDTGAVGVFVPLTDGLPYRAEGAAEVGGRYYMRTTTDTTVMPHQILAALFGRSPQPKLRLGFSYELGDIKLLVENRGGGAAGLVMVRFTVHPGLQGFLEPGAGWQLRVARDRDLHTEWYAVLALEADERVFPGEARIVGTFADPSRYRASSSARDTFTARIDCVGAPPVVYERVEVPGFTHDERTSWPEPA